MWWYVLIAMWWYLLKHPEHAVKIQNEIINVDVTDANSLALLPHLNAVINEVLRLAPMTSSLKDGTLILNLNMINAHLLHSPSVSSFLLFNESTC